MNPLERLWDAVKYERRYEGMAEKDGRPYKKYSKIHRFRSRHRRLALYALLAALAAPVVYAVVTRVLGSLESAPAESAAPETEAPAQ